MLWSGLCLCHVFRFRQLVYSLYTFMNNGLVLSIYTTAQFNRSSDYCSRAPIIQFSSVLSHKDFHRISQHSYREFPTLMLKLLSPLSLPLDYGDIFMRVFNIMRKKKGGGEMIEQILYRANTLKT